jgi:hypothetical protein
MLTKTNSINPFEHELRVGQTNWRLDRLPTEVSDQFEDDLDILGVASNAYDSKIELNQNLTGMSAFESIIRFGIHAINETDGLEGLQLTPEQVEQLGYRVALFLAHNDWVLDYAKEKINEEYGTNL